MFYSWCLYNSLGSERVFIMVRPTQIILPWLALASRAFASPCSAGAEKKPNFVLIMTDDQDKLLNSVDYQPAVQKHFIEQGTTFDKHYVTMAQCCPSRVSFLTGMAGHNTNVTDVKPPYGRIAPPSSFLRICSPDPTRIGGYSKFVSQGFHENYFPVWMQEAGYNTYYAGKLMNGHMTETYNDPYPGGLNQTNCKLILFYVSVCRRSYVVHNLSNTSEVLIEPNVYVFYNATYQKNQDPPHYMPGSYSTDVMAESAVEFLEHAASDKDRPFSINIMPVGPHFEAQIIPGQPTQESILYPPVPAKRHEHLYPNVTVPRTENFNPETVSESSCAVRTIHELMPLPTARRCRLPQGYSQVEPNCCGLPRLLLSPPAASAGVGG